MKVVLTCGYPIALAAKAHGILSEARLIRPADADLVALQPRTPDASQFSPDTAYRELAKSVLLGQSGDHPLGFAGSPWLVDFWRSLEEQAGFIFVYSRPEDTFDELRGEPDAGEQQLERALSDWVVYYTEVLRCYFQNPGKCLLVHADALCEPSAFIRTTLQFMGLTDSGIFPLHPGVGSTKSAIEQVLARAAIAARGLRVEVYDDLESSADLPGTFGSAHDWILCKQAREEYSTLLSREEQASVRMRADEFALEDFAAVGRTLNAELLEQRAAAAGWKKRFGDLQTIEAALTAEQRELRIQIDYWKERASELEALSRERGARAKVFESSVLSLSNKLDERELHVDGVFAESQRLRSQGVELQKECDLVTQQWLRAEEGLDAQNFLMKIANDAAAAALAAKDRELDDLRQTRRELENDCAISGGEIAHLQRELECALIQCSILSTNATQESTGPAPEVALLPNAIACDFREPIDGDNWYDAEHDGRWAGPRRVSAVRLPRLCPGEYRFEIEVVDAMNPQYIADLELLLNGKRIEFSRGKGWRRYPAILKGEFSTSMVPDRESWEFQFAFPGLSSPADKGSDDNRLLAVRVRTLKVVLLHASGLH